MKLNLACSKDIKEGYINVDLRRTGKEVIPADALNLPFKNDVFEEIYVSHFMEHLRYMELVPALWEWKRVLHPQGILRICVPDFSVIAVKWAQADINHKLRWWNWAICGSQHFIGDDHHCILDAEVIYHLISRAGFVTLEFSRDPEWDFWLWAKVKKT